MSWAVACAASELSEGVPFSAEVAGQLVAIVPTGGELFAIQDECSHGRVMLSLGEVDGCTLECMAHGSRFDLRTGEPIDLPATRPVPVYPVRIEGDDVLVDLDSPIDPAGLAPARRSTVADPTAHPNQPSNQES